MSVSQLSDASIDTLKRLITDFYGSEAIPKAEYLRSSKEIKEIRIAKTVSAEEAYPTAGNTYEVELGEYSYDNSSPGDTDGTWTAYSPQTIRIARTVDGSSIPENTIVVIFLSHGRWYILDSSPINFFKLIEDCSGEYGPAYARITNRTGATNGMVVSLYWWDSLLNNAESGYKGLCSIVNGEYVFVQGPCVVECPSDGTITPGSPPDGTKNSVYAGHTVSSSNINAGTLAASGLPSGLVMDTSGNISGTPTESGVFHVQISGTATATGGSDPTCTITVVMVLTVNEP